MRAWLRPVAAVAYAAFFVAIGTNLASAQGPAPALTKVTFSLDFIPLGRHAAWYAALAEGFYKDEGLDVSIIPAQGTAQAVQAVNPALRTLVSSMFLASLSLVAMDRASRSWR